LHRLPRVSLWLDLPWVLPCAKLSHLPPARRQLLSELFWLTNRKPLLGSTQSGPVPLESSSNEPDFTARYQNSVARVSSLKRLVQVQFATFFHPRDVVSEVPWASYPPGDIGVLPGMITERHIAAERFCGVGDRKQCKEAQPCRNRMV
jgi:hypothetical protein